MVVGTRVCERHPTGRRLPAAVCALVAFAGLAGCVTPAVPIHTAEQGVAPTAAATDTPQTAPPGPDVNANGSAATDPQPFAGLSTQPPNGEYDIRVILPVFGPLTARFIFQPTGPDSFKANTRPGFAWQPGAGLDGIIPPILSAFIFPSGMVLHWAGQLPTTTADGEGFIGIATIGPLRTKVVHPRSGPIRVLTRQDRTIALLEMRPAVGQRATDTDYPALVQALFATVEREWFDPSQVGSPQTRAFRDDLSVVSASATDDLEFLFNFFLAWQRARDLTPAGEARPNPGERPSRSDRAFALLYREPDPTAPAFPRDDSTIPALAVIPPRKPGEASTPRTQDALAVHRLTASLFTSAADVDDAMKQLAEQAPGGFVLDLSNSVGPTLASLRVLAWLISEPVDIGVYFNRDVRSGPAPTAQQAAALPQLTLATPEDYARADAALASLPAARLRVLPAGVAGSPLAGRVGVVIGRRTLATSEVLAAALKSLSGGRATVRLFGETTGKQPTFTVERSLGQGWLARIPTHDWRPTWPFTPADSPKPSQPPSPTTTANTAAHPQPWAGVDPSGERTSRDAALRAAAAFVSESSPGKPSASAEP